MFGGAQNREWTSNSSTIVEYNCNYCQKKYNRHQNLLRHVRNIHGEHSNPVTCMNCGKTYKNQSTLREHTCKMNLGQ
ncbi:hypothetical protein B566_EDAN016984 [Ephemera danica]|nr:hypothetical protein B566_EDAN016984 [Ephemera danica]